MDASIRRIYVKIAGRVADQRVVYSAIKGRIAICRVVAIFAVQTELVLILQLITKTVLKGDDFYFYLILLF